MQADQRADTTRATPRMEKSTASFRAGATRATRRVDGRDAHRRARRRAPVDLHRHHRDARRDDAAHGTRATPRMEREEDTPPVVVIIAIIVGIVIVIVIITA